MQWECEHMLNNQSAAYKILNALSSCKLKKLKQIKRIKINEFLSFSSPNDRFLCPIFLALIDVALFEWKVFALKQEPKSAFGRHFTKIFILANTCPTEYLVACIYRSQNDYTKQ